VSIATRQRGATLVELVLVMLVLGIIGASAALFLRGPVLAVFEQQRRAALTDAADTAARRVLRELQGAVPNSIRIAAVGANVFIEFMPIDAGGRYRAAAAAENETAGVDPLDVGDAADGSFQVLGPAVQVAAGAQLVVFNLGAGEFDLYAGNNRRTITGATGARQTLSFATTGSALNADSPARRFFLTRTPVTFACIPGAGGSGRIDRLSGYSISAAQPVSLGSGVLATSTIHRLVDSVESCNFALGATLANANAVALTLQLTSGGESVALHLQAVLGNTP
jgi:MSHA biogenesis protein MshO